jgi:hypothetical protein
MMRVRCSQEHLTLIIYILRSLDRSIFGDKITGWTGAVGRLLTWSLKIGDNRTWISLFSDHRGNYRIFLWRKCLTVWGQYLDAKASVDGLCLSHFFLNIRLLIFLIFSKSVIILFNYVRSISFVWIYIHHKHIIPPTRWCLI